MHLLGKAFQAFDNALKLILDNTRVVGDHPLIKPMAIATKLALCHAKAAVSTSKSSQADTAHVRHLAEVALRRATEIQDVLLVFSAEHMVAQTERVIQAAPPKLAEVGFRFFRNAGGTSVVVAWT